MKVEILLLALLSVSFARPQNYKDAYIIRYDNYNNGFGGWYFHVATSDGFEHRQRGRLNNVGTKREGPAVIGSYSYIGPDGVTYTVEYTADEDGFQPAGKHLPKSAGVRKLGIPPLLKDCLAGCAL